NDTKMLFNSILGYLEFAPVNLTSFYIKDDVVNSLRPTTIGGHTTTSKMLDVRSSDRETTMSIINSMGSADKYGIEVTAQNAGNNTGMYIQAFGGTNNTAIEI